MKITLTPIEIRVLGALIEKSATTPESYPLSLNALTNACNQKTNREPVMKLAESTVLEASEHLIRETLISQRSGASSRVSKYAHRLSNRLTEEYNFTPSELAVLAVLMLRGPQTAGEIRIRSTRLHEFADVLELEQTLHRLAEREDGPFVTKLARLGGHKEPRYAQLLGGEIECEELAMPLDSSITVSDDSARISELEIKVQALTKQLSELQQKVDAFIQQFE